VSLLEGKYGKSNPKLQDFGIASRHINPHKGPRVKPNTPANNYPANNTPATTPTNTYPPNTPATNPPQPQIAA
jgi:hypothetical protein